MYEELRSPSIHFPQNLSECNAILSRNNGTKPRLWAGGTYLMNQESYYPNENTTDIIDLGMMPELKRVTRSDRFLEIGSMVTASQLLSAGRLVLPEILLEALDGIASHILQRQVTIGGALCIPDRRYSFSTALSVLDAMAELRLYRNRKVTTTWIPITKLYDRNGSFLYKDDIVLMTRVRIGLEYGDYQRFSIVEHPIRNPDECIIFAFQAKRSQNGLSAVQFCIDCPGKAFHISKELQSRLTGSPLPMDPKKVTAISYELVDELKKQHGTITDLQLERSRRMFESVLHDMNAQALQN